MPASRPAAGSGDYWQRHDPWKSVLEAVLEKNIPYMSGPQWLHDLCCATAGCWPLLVHTAKPPRGNGDLDSGTVRLQTRICDRRVPGNFEVSARLGESDFFVIKRMSTTAPFSTNALNLSITAAYADPQQP